MTTPDLIADSRAGMPTRQRIATFWKGDPNSCWKCGKRRYSEGSLDRCHIVPLALGGKNEPSNLVILCGDCHRKAPDVLDPGAMWHFIDRGDEEGFRYMETFHEIMAEAFKSPEFAEFNAEFPQIFEAVLMEELASAGFHGGSIAFESKIWCLRRTVAEVSKRAIHRKAVENQA